MSVPHPLLAEDAEICLITKDPAASYQNAMAAAAAFSPTCARVTRVLGVTDLKHSYKEYEARRKLCNSHTLFLADERVSKLLSPLLGKEFFRKKKLPAVVRLPRPTKVEEIARVIEDVANKTFIAFRAGSCCMVKVRAMR